VDDAVDRHIQKVFLKVKTISKSGKLPETIMSQKFPQWDHATTNVTARLYNSKQVKDAMNLLVEFVRNELIDAPRSSEPKYSEEKGMATKKTQREVDQGIDVQMARNHDTGQMEIVTDESVNLNNELVIPAHMHSPPFIPRVVEQASDSESPNGQTYKYDKESHGDIESLNFIATDDAQIPTTRYSFPQVGEARYKEEVKPDPLSHKSPKSSAFLPSLTAGGYISRSESEASDVENEIAPRKNRRGQQARRQIAERKYGANANHLQKEKSKKTGRDQGWDARRGAISSERVGRRVDRKTLSSQLPKEKARRKDDSGPLHPSWVAKKTAKGREKLLSQQYAGTKVLFD
jgi:hypothetical protein